MSTKSLSRRQFLVGAAGAAGVGLLAACTPQVIEKTVIVEQTVEVEKEVEVEKVVEQTVQVEVEVEKEVVRIKGEPVWEPPSLAGKEYKFWGLQYDPHVETYNRLAASFEEMTGAKATVEPQAWPIENQIITAMAAGLTPDICCIMGKQIAPLVLQDAVLPIDEMVFEMIGCDTQSWFSPVSIQAYEYFGKTYGVPTEGNMVSSVTNIRMDFLAEAPADIQAMWPPANGKAGFESFDDMWALAEALQVVDSDGVVTRWGLSSRGWDNRHTFGIMRTLGTDWWDPESRTFNMTSEAAIEAMRFQVDTPVWQRKIETELQDNFDTAIMAGKIAVGCGNVCIPGVASKESIQVDSCVYPSAIKGREPLFIGEGGWGFIVPAQAKEQEVGIEFLKYIATYEGQKNYCWMYGGEYEGVRFAGNVPAAVAVAEGDHDVYPDINYIGKAFRRVVPAQRSTNYYGSDFGNPGEMEGIASAAVSYVRTGEKSIQDALTECQGLLEEMLSRWDIDKAVKAGG